MRTWQVVYSAAAEQDLTDIFRYIAQTLLSPEHAKAQVQRIMNAVDALAQLPLRHPIYPNDPWKTLNVRFVAVNHYLVFYLTNESASTVAIVRIVYAARNVSKLLADPPPSTPTP